MTDSIPHIDAKVRRKKFVPKVIVAFTPDCDKESLINTAKLLAENEQVLLYGFIPVSEGENITEQATKAAQLRSFLVENADRIQIKARPRVRVSYSPWEELQAEVEKYSVNMLVLDWSSHESRLTIPAETLLNQPPCDVALVRGPIPAQPENLMVALRGGPQAECAMALGLKLARPAKSTVTTIHLQKNRFKKDRTAGFEGLRRILPEMKDVTHKTVDSADYLSSLLKESKLTDVMLIGTTSEQLVAKSSVGTITDGLLQQAHSGVIAVKSKRSFDQQSQSEKLGSHAISVLVDRWFAENTFHADEFSDLEKLAALKQERGLSVAIALPTLNEEETIGKIIDIIQKEAMEQFPLVDELIVVDSRSTDRTAEIVKEKGVPMYVHQDVLPQHGARPGKGEALWKSLYLTKSDIVLWLDTDVSNFQSHFIYGLLGPLLYRPDLQLIKGFYRRPLKTGHGLQKGRGGRVTELTARPLFNLFYPELTGIIQPLSGEYGGRRELLEQLAFTSGYGVETCILIDTIEKAGLASIGQVDIFERVHNNQPLHALSKMSFSIIQTVISRLEKRYGSQMLDDINRTMKMIKHSPSGEYHLDLQEVAELERPPIIELPEYRAIWGDTTLALANE